MHIFKTPRPILATFKSQNTDFEEILSFVVVMQCFPGGTGWILWYTIIV
jgi:hypothetical protein